MAGPHPGQLGVAPPPAAARVAGLPAARRARRWVPPLAAGALLVVAVILVTGLWHPGFFRTTELDIVQAQKSIQQLLADPAQGYGPGHVGDVVCNSGRNPAVTAGGSFICTVSIDGAARQLTATFQNDRGDFLISVPK
jgi:hypothetical protein